MFDLAARAPAARAPAAVGLFVLFAVACSTKPVNTNVNRLDAATGDRPIGQGDPDPTGDGGADAFVRPDVGPCTMDPAVKKAMGEPCTCTGECTSGLCVDGVCCSSACTGPCVACNVEGSKGSCTPVPDGKKPVNPSQCVPTPAEGCGLDGMCNGAGACRKWPDGTVCAPGQCEGAAIAGQKVCTGGKCMAAASIACFPYACDPGRNQCYDKCTGDGQCAGEICKVGQCGKKALGAVCAAAGECESEFCADGFCCNVACAGACVSCHQVGKLGQCTPVPVGHMDPHKMCPTEGPETCGMSGVCNGQGGCARYAAGTVCKPGACSGSGSFSPPSVCNGLGICEPGSPISCAPFTCENGVCRGTCDSNADCTPPSTCQARSCGKKGLGQTCGGAGECESGFCADGVCCDSACAGKCTFCAAPNALGRCVNVPANTADPRQAAGETNTDRVCADQGAWTCGTNGKCDGQGGCASYANGTVCQPETCDPASNRYTIGTCRDGQCALNMRTCSPNRCNGNQCGQRCAADVECATPNVCVKGSCGKKGNGEPCSAGNASECASGICAQGVCCASACTGSCVSCAMAQAPGTCTPVANGAADPAGACKDDKAASCRNDGLCDGKGKCRLYPAGTVCVPASCSNDKAKKVSLCDGQGVCVPGTETACTPIKVCNVQGTACEKTCTSDSQCVTGTKCFQGRCGLLDNGQACTGNSDCKTGFCVDGVCCDKACGGNNQNDCQACAKAAGAAADGKCGPRTAAAKCSDANACTLNDTCVGTVCTGTPVVCTVISQCHEAGVCDKATGKCTTAFKAKGAGCDDSNKCSSGDACDGAGKCLGTAVSCPAGDQCKTGMCDPATGMCAMPNKLDGTPCDDTSKCTQTDKCRAGVCVGENPVSCPADACRLAGTCNAGTGLCTRANKPDGTVCYKSGDKCVTGKCGAGECGNFTPKTCSSGNECVTDGSCDPVDGMCKGGASKPNGTACSDENMCTDGDSCQSGMCKGNTKTCPGAGVCTGVTCDPSNGCTSPKDKPCNDGSMCTSGDKCNEQGMCGGTAVTCQTPSVFTPCFNDPVCDPTKGCVRTPKPKDTPCDDLDECTDHSVCDGMGKCVGGTAQLCAPPSNMCKTSICEDGMCREKDRAGVCDDGDKCTLDDKCSGGTCVPGSRLICKGGDQCSTVVCDPMTGGCTIEPLTGSDCDDNNPCTLEDKCLAGICTGGQLMNCDDNQPCTADRCDPMGDSKSPCVHVPLPGCPLPGVGSPDNR